jgi:hypothetical protein
MSKDLAIDVVLAIVPESACIVTRKKKQKMYFQKFGMRIVHRRENMGCQEPDRWILCFGITEQAFGSTDIDSMAGEKRAKCGRRRRKYALVGLIPTFSSETPQKRSSTWNIRFWISRTSVEAHAFPYSLFKAMSLLEHYLSTAVASLIFGGTVASTLCIRFVRK